MVKILSFNNRLLPSTSQHDIHRTDRRSNLQHYLFYHDSSWL